MNFSVTTVVMLIAGTALMYAAVKNEDPRDIVRKAMGKAPKYGALSKEEIGVIRALPDKAGGGGGAPKFTGNTFSLLPLPITGTWPSN